MSVENDQIALHLFRIAQEALNKSIRHAGASLIVIRLQISNGQLCLELLDDGSGFEDRADDQRGLG